MEIIIVIGSIVLWVLGVIWSIIWWFLSFLLMPLLILFILVAIALRYAYRTPSLKPSVERMFSRLGEKGLNRLKAFLYLITVQPIRIVLRFIWFSILHAWINLWWKPKWTPWERAKRSPQPK